MTIHEHLRKIADPGYSANAVETFDLLKVVSAWINSGSDADEARDVVIRILDVKHKFPREQFPIIESLTESVGLYPYLNNSSLSGSKHIRLQAHKSKYLENIYLHEDQRKVSDTLADKSVVLSAPTSYGKSLLIKEMVASRKYKNIVIIQPTLALLDETRKSLVKFNDYYNLIVTTDEIPSERNIFLFTAERVSEYEHFETVDFFVIDEFYKLSGERDDERSTALNIALYKLLQYTKHFYFLGPHIYKISDGFCEVNQAEWIRSDFTTVSVDIEKIKGSRGGELKGSKKLEALFELLDKCENQSLIYCSQRSRVANIANEYLMHQTGNRPPMLADSELKDIQEWIEENVHFNWRLNNMLASGIAFHHGSIPRHLGSAIVELFNKGKIKYLFCTPTLIEGVNTSAENVILYDHKKGLEPLDYFDFKNIAGRSGRMNQHFIGKVYQFSSVEEEDDIEVDIPMFTQKKATLELLIQMKDEDLTPESKELLSDFNSLPQNEQELIRKNVGAPVAGQIRLLKKLKEDPSLLNVLRMENVDYPTVTSVMEICFEYLVFESDRRGAFSPRQVALYLMRFLHRKNLSAMIENAIEKSPNEDVQRIIEVHLYIFRNWFGYTLPKMLFAIYSILEYVDNGKSHGKYIMIIDNLDTQFINKNLMFLREYGVPTSALKKIQRIISADAPKEVVLNILKRSNLNELGLINYEIGKINNILNG